MLKPGSFDAIVCDPPYGLRARVNKITTFEDNKDEDVKIKKLTKFDDKNQGIFYILLQTSANLLRPGGFLVFFFFTDEANTPEENSFPTHSSL